MLTMPKECVICGAFAHEAFIFYACCSRFMTLALWWWPASWGLCVLVCVNTAQQCFEPRPQLWLLFITRFYTCGCKSRVLLSESSH
jgi:hypothetical protein